MLGQGVCAGFIPAANPRITTCVRCGRRREDHQAMTTTQDRAIRHLLAQLELISHGTITAYNSAGGHDSEHPGGRRPTGEAVPPHDRYRALYIAATTDDRREHLIDQARDELRTLRKANTTAVVIHEETDAEFDQRAARMLGNGWTIDEVARSMRCTPTRIRRAQATSKHPDIQELASQGMTVRGIAMRTGLSKSEVHRILKRAA